MLLSYSIRKSYKLTKVEEDTMSRKLERQRCAMLQRRTYQRNRVSSEYVALQLMARDLLYSKNPYTLGYSTTRFEIFATNIRNDKDLLKKYCRIEADWSSLMWKRKRLIQKLALTYTIIRQRLTLLEKEIEILKKEKTNILGQNCIRKKALFNSIAKKYVERVRLDSLSSQLNVLEDQMKLALDRLRSFSKSMFTLEELTI